MSEGGEVRVVARSSSYGVGWDRTFGKDADAVTEQG